MSSDVDQIEAGFKRLFKHDSISFIAKVIEDKDDNVDVEDLSGTKYLEVRKIATAGKKGMLFKLPVDSFVLVSRISQSDELFVSMMSEIEGIFIKVGETTIDITDEIVMNGGGNKGLAKITELVSKYNAIEQSINQLKQIMIAWTPAPGDGGGVLKGLITTWAGQPLQLTTENEIQNQKIKH